MLATPTPAGDAPSAEGTSGFQNQPAFLVWSGMSVASGTAVVVGAPENLLQSVMPATLDCSTAAREVTDRTVERIESIRAIATAALRATGYRDLAALDCEIFDRTIAVSGTVPSYYLKQIAQAVLARIDGVFHVENLVEVR